VVVAKVEKLLLQLFDHLFELLAVLETVALLAVALVDLLKPILGLLQILSQLRLGDERGQLVVDILNAALLRHSVFVEVLQRGVRFQLVANAVEIFFRGVVVQV